MLIAPATMTSLYFGGMTASGEACAKSKGVFEARSSSMTAHMRALLGQNNVPKEIWRGVRQGEVEIVITHVDGGFVPMGDTDAIEKVKNLFLVI
jgi:hypothetical protein